MQKPHELTAYEIRKHGLERFLLENKRTVFLLEAVLNVNTGYLGRTSIHELFQLDDVMQRAVMEGSDASTLHAIAREQGTLLVEDGLRKVLEG